MILKGDITLPTFLLSSVNPEYVSNTYYAHIYLYTFHRSLQ